MLAPNPLHRCYDCKVVFNREGSQLEAASLIVYRNDDRIRRKPTKDDLLLCLLLPDDSWPLDWNIEYAVEAWWSPASNVETMRFPLTAEELCPMLDRLRDGGAILNEETEAAWKRWEAGGELRE